MLDVKGGLPFDDNEGVKWRSLSEALRHMDYRGLYLDGSAEKTILIQAALETFREGIKSLELLTHEDYADFLRNHVESGGQLDTVSGRFHYDYPVTIFKTTKPLTFLPFGEGRFHLDIMVQRGHTLKKEKENDDCKVYDLNGDRPMPHLTLLRDTADLMLRRGWSPKEEHFGEFCYPAEIDKLLKRGKKLHPEKYL